MNFDLKQTLKSLKLNESRISMILGAVVVLVIGSLAINYFKGRGLKNENKTSSTSVTTEDAFSLTQNDNQKKHTVSKGESLWTISEKYYNSGFSWTAIAKENNLENPGVVEVGQTLIIPQIKSQEKTADTSVKTAVSSEEAGAISQTQYTIEKGDSLWKIAVRAYGDGYKWVEIAKENKLKNPNIIHPKNILVLPR